MQNLLVKLPCVVGCLFEQMLLAHVESSTRSRAHIDADLVKVLILVGLGIPYGCERTKIYADSQYSLSNSSSLPSSLGICTLDEDCPQWDCVGSKCEEGECVAYRNEGEFSSLDLSSSRSCA